MTDANGTELRVGQRLRVVAHRSKAMIDGEMLATELLCTPHGNMVRAVSDDGCWSAWLMPTEVVVIGEAPNA